MSRISISLHLNSDLSIVFLLNKSCFMKAEI